VDYKIDGFGSQNAGFMHLSGKWQTLPKVNYRSGTRSSVDAPSRFKLVGHQGQLSHMGDKCFLWVSYETTTAHAQEIVMTVWTNGYWDPNRSGQDFSLAIPLEEVLVVNADNGRVGVGHEDPKKALHVNGDAMIEGKLLIPPSGDVSMGDFTGGEKPQSVSAP